VKFAVAAPVALHAPVVGENVGIGPAVIAELAPMVEIARVAARIHHAVDRGRAAQHLAARHAELAVIERRVGLALVIPVEFALERGRYESERHLDEELVVAPARFEQQDGDFRIGAQTVGEHAARRPRADNNVIVMHVPALRPASRRRKVQGRRRLLQACFTGQSYWLPTVAPADALTPPLTPATPCVPPSSMLLPGANGRGAPTLPGPLLIGVLASLFGSSAELCAISDAL